LVSLGGGGGGGGGGGRVLFHFSTETKEREEGGWVGFFMGGWMGGWIGLASQSTIRPLQEHLGTQMNGMIVWRLNREEVHS
jgi:hypothetical protein